MLRGVYEDNRRIKEGSAADMVRRRRKATMMSAFGLAALLIVVVSVQMFFSATTPESASGQREGVVSILDANLPELAPLPDAELTFDPDEFQALMSGDTPIAALFDLQVRTIVIDPGHGGQDPGALGLRGTAEKDVTLDVADRLRRRLERRGYTVLMTRESDSTVSLRERVEFANSQATDLFVSIHANSFPDEPVNALETYYFGANTDETLLRLAEAENEGADYTLADFNSMIRRLSSTVKLQESRRLALAVQRSMVSNTRAMIPDVQDWGVKPGPFVVLLGSDAPSILAEISVLTNATQAERLRTSAHREQLAAFLEEGILKYLVDRGQRQTSTPQ